MPTRRPACSLAPTSRHPCAAATEPPACFATAAWSSPAGARLRSRGRGAACPARTVAVPACSSTKSWPAPSAPSPRLRCATGGVSRPAWCGAGARLWACTCWTAPERAKRSRPLPRGAGVPTGNTPNGGPSKPGGAERRGPRSRQDRRQRDTTPSPAFLVRRVLADPPSTATTTPVGVLPVVGRFSLATAPLRGYSRRLAPGDMRKGVVRGCPTGFLPCGSLRAGVVCRV
jgi:hypothetical protein